MNIFLPYGMIKVTISNYNEKTDQVGRFESLGVIGIATGYGLDDRMIGVRFPVGAGNFSLRHRVQTGSGAHPAFYPIGTGFSFPGVKSAGA
jgi:hypothetical protein